MKKKLKSCMYFQPKAKQNKTRQKKNTVNKIISSNRFHWHNLIHDHGMCWLTQKKNEHTLIFVNKISHTSYQRGERTKKNEGTSYNCNCAMICRFEFRRTWAKFIELSKVHLTISCKEYYCVAIFETISYQHVNFLCFLLVFFFYLFRSYFNDAL